MTVKELFGKIVDNYVELAVNEYYGNKHLRRWIIPMHSVNKEKNIPETILNLEVRVIVPYFNRISIEVENQDKGKERE